MKRAFLLHILACVAVLLFIPGQNFADTVLYGTTNTGDVTTLSDLVTINTTTGAVTTIGSIGYKVNGLTYDATTNTLYGSTSTSDPNFVGLISINTNTGAGTTIGPGNWATGSVNSVNNITSDSAGNMFGWAEGPEDLVSIDKNAGTYTVVGDSGISTSEYGLAFDNSDDLFIVGIGSGNTFSVDAGTGAASFLFDIGSTAHHGDFNPDNNFYYGLTGFGVDPSTINYYDMTNGSLVGSFDTASGFAIHTLAFAIPEPGSMAVLVGALGALVLRRRRSR